MGRVPGGSNTSQRFRNNIPDFQRAVSVKILIKGE